MKTNEKIVLDWFTSDKLVPYSIYYYPASVDDIIYECPEEEASINIKKTFDYIKEIVLAATKWNQMDNKITVICKLYHLGAKIALNWYDGNLRIGLAGYNKDGGAAKLFELHNDNDWHISE